MYCMLGTRPCVIKVTVLARRFAGLSSLVVRVAHPLLVLLCFFVSLGNFSCPVVRTNQRAEFKNCAVWLGGTIQAFTTRELAGSSSLWWQLEEVTDYTKCLNCVAVSLSICQVYVCLFVPPVSLTWDHQKIQHLRSGLMDYRIVGNFCWESFCVNCSLMPPKDAMPLNFARKTFMNSHKILKFAKVFFLKSFPLYGMSNWIPLPSVFLCTRYYTQTFGHWFMLMVGLYSKF